MKRIVKVVFIVTLSIVIGYGGGDALVRIVDSDQPYQTFVRMLPSLSPSGFRDVSTTTTTYASSADEKLFSAIRSGNISAVKKILRFRGEQKVNAQYRTSGCFGGGVYSVLDTALEQPAMLKTLLEKEPRQEFRDAALRQALRRGLMESARVLLEYGANPGGLDNALWYLVDSPYGYGAPLEPQGGWDKTVEECAKLLIEKGADVKARGEQYGETALHVAALTGHVSLARLLIDLGVDVNTMDNRGYTPLHWAMALDPADYTRVSGSGRYNGGKRTYADVIRLLLDHGARMDEASASFIPWSGNTQLVGAWLETAKDVDVRDAYGRTPLHMAVANGNLELAQHLIARGANVNAEASKRTRRELSAGAPLFYAIFPEVSRSEYLPYALSDINLALIRYLLEQGADPRYRYDYISGATPLFHLVVERIRKKGDASERVAILLLQNGEDVNVLDKGGLNALQSTNSPTPPMIAFLVAHGADVDARYENGNTKLHYAAGAATIKPEIVKALLEAGANPSLKNNEGKTPLDHAYEVRDRLRKKSSELQKKWIAGLLQFSDNPRLNRPMNRISEDSDKNEEIIDMLKRHSN